MLRTPPRDLDDPRPRNTAPAPPRSHPRRLSRLLRPVGRPPTSSRYTSAKPSQTPPKKAGRASCATPVTGRCWASAPGWSKRRATGTFVGEVGLFNYQPRHIDSSPGGHARDRLGALARHAGQRLRNRSRASAASPGRDRFTSDELACLIVPENHASTSRRGQMRLRTALHDDRFAARPPLSTLPQHRRHDRVRNARRSVPGEVIHPSTRTSVARTQRPRGECFRPDRLRLQTAKGDLNEPPSVHPSANRLGRSRLAFAEPGLASARPAS